MCVVRCDQVRLNRASRTDKGVHALANVMTIKLECDRNYWLDGNNGADLVSQVNAKLPEDVRVFSATPVTKGYTPRAFCNGRTYDFYIPARALGIDAEKEGDDAIGKSLEAFQKDVLPLFCGYKPYHNFTVKRLYSKKVRSKQKQKLDEKHERMNVREVGGDGGGIQVKRSFGDEQEKKEGEAKTVGEVLVVPADVSPDQKQDGEELNIERFCKNVKWFHTFNEKTKLDRAHYRTIHSVTCDSALIDLGKGKEEGEVQLALRVTIEGESFMYHQIRHMIGLMIAAYRGMIPKAFISAVLSAPANVVLPFAPAHTHVLKRLSFGPFARQDFKNRDPDDKLTITRDGEVMQNTFEDEKLRPVLGDFLSHKDWIEFERFLELWKDDLDDMSQVERFIATHQGWSERLALRRKDQKENKTNKRKQSTL